jgi:hypothetical protein
VASDLGERAGQLDARRARADDDERQPVAARGRVRGALRVLVGEQDPAADVLRIGAAIAGAARPAVATWYSSGWNTW